MQDPVALTTDGIDASARVPRLALHALTLGGAVLAGWVLRECWSGAWTGTFSLAAIAVTWAAATAIAWRVQPSALDRLRRQAAASREDLLDQVAERKKADEDKARVEATLRAILNSLGDGVIVADGNGRLLFSNPSAERILGSRVGPGRDQHWSESIGVFRGDGVTPLPHDELPIVRALRGEVTDGVEVYLRNSSLPHGACVRFFGRPLLDAAGVQLGGVVAFSDITELKLTEDKLLEKVKLLDLAREAIIVHGVDGRVQFWNRGAEELYGWTKEDAVSHVSHTLLQASHPQSLEAIRATAFRLGTWEGELTHVRRDGTRILVESRWAVKKDAHGRATAILEINRDVTARKRAEKELVFAKDAAEAASRAKSEFVANMSHEIRTPMNGVLGMLDLTLRTELNPRQREFLALARTSAHSLLRLLNDILDFSRLEAHKLELEAVPFRVREAIGEAIKARAVQAAEKSLELTCRFAPDVPVALVGDPGRLLQIVNNLVGNAIKFTQEGEVAVEVEVESRWSDAVALVLSVRDTGIGIDPAKQRRIFDAFTQGDNTTTRRYGGSGLGLTITRQLTAMMGGRLEVESQLGRGSTFRATLRLATSRTPTPVPWLDPAPLRNLSVLVADAHDTNRALLVEVLLALGMRPRAVCGGKVAIEELERAAAAGTPYRLAVLDARLPHADGYAVAARCRSQAGARCGVVLVLPPVDGDRAGTRMEELGRPPCVRKPVLPEEVLDAALAALDEREQPQPSIGAVPAPALPVPARSLRVLLAEDNPVNQVLAVHILESRGHRVVVASDGREALDRLGAEEFDLALLDVSMPEMDGYEVTGALREREKGGTRRLPVIAMTAHAKKGDRERCLAAGMDDYVSKPIRMDDFVMAVEGRWAAPPLPLPDEESDPCIDFDLVTALHRARGDRTLLLEMARLFLRDAPALLADLEDGLARGDSAATQRLAHRLRGSLGNFGAPAAFDAAAELEVRADRGDLSGASELGARLTRRVRRLMAALTLLRGEVPA